MNAPITLQVGAKALLKNSQNKYLVVRRSLEKYPNVSGRWDIVGGRINPGFSLFENLKREIFEETKIKIDNQIPKIIMAQDILRIPGKHVVRITYEITYLGNPEITLDKEENDEYKWLTIEEIKNQEDLDMFLSEVIDKFF